MSRDDPVFVWEGQEKFMVLYMTEFTFLEAIHGGASPRMQISELSNLKTRPLFSITTALLNPETVRFS